MIQKSALIYKKLGETPLEALERFRVIQASEGRAEFAGIPMTYAGRLDPMAEGLLLILLGDECKMKEKYLGLGKTYEVEIVFGISTDTHDMLGLAEMKDRSGAAHPAAATDVVVSKVDLQKYVGKFEQRYPAYSSKTVDGRQLHELARAGELPDAEDMPSKQVEIHSIELLEVESISADMLRNRIFSSIDLVKGGFRQDEIKDRWTAVFSEKDFPEKLKLMKIKVDCSSGTYMRALAHRIGAELGCGAFALSIKRTILGPYQF
ncbi:MAG: truB [Candidatus Taylorbacteria bacterium]|nr:truB [Candidatus Taylorbacteria bacterium]